MEEDPEPPFASMKACAQIIDEGLDSIGRAVSSIESLMPSEEHSENAEALMLAVLEESKELEKLTEIMKKRISASADAVKAENKKVTETIDEMVAELDRIEDSLEKFGYLRFQAAENGVSEEELCNLTESVDISGTNEEDAYEISDVDGHDGLEGEITPFITGTRKSLRSSNNVYLSSNGRHHEAKGETPTSSAEARKKIGFDPSPLNPSIKSPSSLVCKTPVVPSSHSKIRDMPKMPIFSRVTYEFLGKCPPPECSAVPEN